MDKWAGVEDICSVSRTIGSDVKRPRICGVFFMHYFCARLGSGTGEGLASPHPPPKARIRLTVDTA
jgi:hypothetical protein